MNDSVNLLGYIGEQTEDFLVRKRRLDIKRDHDSLESSVAVYLENRRGEIAKFHSDDSFKIYQEVEDLDDTIFLSYRGILNKFKSRSYSIKGIGLLERAVYETSIWWENNPFSDSLKVDNLFKIAVSGSSIAASALAGSYVTGDLFGAIAGGIIGAALNVRFFWTRRDLDSEKYEFNRGIHVVEVVEDAHNLYLLAQTMQREVEDIEELPRSQAETLVKKYGEKGIMTRVKRVKEEINEVKIFAYNVLLAAGVPEERMPKLDPEYVPSAVRKAKGVQELLRDPHDSQLRELRARRLASESGKQRLD
ncbi:hypothetical protein J4216_01305 [Candidatus Woesearchaeota archaeon]|nr:hypothetical protein [Candidatus Woesearchaeota archaeon]